MGSLVDHYATGKENLTRYVVVWSHIAAMLLDKGYLVTDSLDEAKRQYREAAELDPANPPQIFKVVSV